jgi:hypothetical protein
MADAPDFLSRLVALANLMRLSLKERRTHGFLPVLRGRKSAGAPVYRFTTVWVSTGWPCAVHSCSNAEGRIMGRHRAE